MENIKITFLGGGNMAFAIAEGMLKSKLVDCKNITISDINADRLKDIAKELSVNTTTDNVKAITDGDVVIIAIKPQIYKKISKDIAKPLANKSVISIMAGVSIDELCGTLDKSTRVLRVMPNMPAMVGEGMTALCTNHTLKGDEYAFAKEVFLSVGEICEVAEHLINAVIGVCGSSPAYAFMFIEALADAGVLHGLSRDVSYKLAAQALKGSAATVQKSNLSPSELKDRVCSPAGTTIEAVKSLENDGFRGTIINAVDACVNKAKRMQDD